MRTAALTGTSTLQVDVRAEIPGRANYCPFALDREADATAGTYQLDVTFDTGPLFGVVDVTTDFEVTGP